MQSENAPIVSHVLRHFLLLVESSAGVGQLPYGNLAEDKRIIQQPTNSSFGGCLPMSHGRDTALSESESNDSTSVPLQLRGEGNMQRRNRFHIFEKELSSVGLRRTLFLHCLLPATPASKRVCACMSARMCVLVRPNTPSLWPKILPRFYHFSMPVQLYLRFPELKSEAATFQVLAVNDSVLNSFWKVSLLWNVDL